MLLLVFNLCLSLFFIVGDSQSELAGIVLFNFAYIITVPSWLNEKKDTVSVNKVIWNSALLSTCLYILFSFMAASAFSQINADMLIILTSPKVFLTIVDFILRLKCTYSAGTLSYTILCGLFRSSHHRLRNSCGMHHTEEHTLRESGCGKEVFFFYRSSFTLLPSVDPVPR